MNENRPKQHRSFWHWIMGWPRALVNRLRESPRLTIIIILYSSLIPIVGLAYNTSWIIVAALLWGLAIYRYYKGFIEYD